MPTTTITLTQSYQQLVAQGTAAYKVQAKPHEPGVIIDPDVRIVYSTTLPADDTPDHLLLLPYGSVGPADGTGNVYGRAIRSTGTTQVTVTT